MKKPSEIFEGEESSLRKTFDKAMKNQICERCKNDIKKDDWWGVSLTDEVLCFKCLQKAKNIKDLYTPKFTMPKISWYKKFIHKLFRV